MKALDLNDTLGEAHVALADAEWFYDWDWPSAERGFKRAIEQNPDSAISHERYPVCLLTRARFDEDIAEQSERWSLIPSHRKQLAVWRGPI
jgi:hypothetical protein